MPYPYTLTPDGHTLEPEDVVKPPAETQEDSTSTQPPKPDPVTGPPAFDSGPSPYLTQEATSHAQPPSTDEEEERREQRIERARQRFENAKQSATNMQLPAGVAQTDSLPDIDDIKSQYVAGIGEITIHPADIEYQLAAQHNPVLYELRCAIRQEGIPPLFQRHPKLYLSMCGEHGMDEENDKEAEDYLLYSLNGDSKHQNTDDPVNAVWQETLTAYEAFKADTENEVAEAAYKSKLEAYQALVENTYGIEFTHVKGRTSWDLLGIRMAHVAFEEMATALSIAVRDYFGLQWDDATAFRRIMGKITIHNSIEPAPKYQSGPREGQIKGIAQVRGDEIVIYWNEKENRNFYLLPHTVLHELGHILNANGAYGVKQFKAWFNFLEDYPESREGMGNPDEDVLIGKTTIYNYSSKRILPTLAEDIGIWNPDHVIFDDLPEWFPRQIQSYQQSPEETNNEKTADAILNWVKHVIAGGRFGFTSDDQGLNWQRIMDRHMDEVIRNAFVHNMMPNDGPIDVSHMGGYPTIYGLATVQAAIGLNARSTPVYLEDGSNVVTMFRNGQRIAILGRSEDGAWIATERYGVLVWASRGTEKAPLLILPVYLNIEDLPVYTGAPLDLDP